MEFENFKISVGDFIREVTPEEVGQMLVFHNFSSVFYTKIDSQGMLVKFLVREDARILADGTHVIQSSIIAVLFARVAELKKIFAYDHFHNLVYYDNDITAVHPYETTHIFPVYTHPDILLEEVVKKIREKPKDGANQK